MADEGGLAAASELAAHNSVTPVSLSALFVAFLTVSLLGFGGGLVWARGIAVDRRRWLSEADFAVS